MDGINALADAGSRTITYAYTSANQLYTVADTAGTATYTYDYAGNIAGVVNPNSTTVTNVYDDAGRLSNVTNKNSSNTTLSSFAYTYNNDDAKTRVDEADGTYVTFTYNGSRFRFAERSSAG